MKSKARIIGLSTLATLGLILAGCDQSNDTPTETNVVATAVPPAIVQAPSVSPPIPQAVPTPVIQPTDPLAPRYEATLEQGIDFKKPGFPNFLASVKGLGIYEPGHRWSDGKTTRFVFKDNLPESFTLQIIAVGFGPNAGKQVVVRVGNVEKTFVLANGDGSYQSHELSFDLSQAENTIEIVSPRPISPAEYTKGINSDARQIAIDYSALRILPFKSINISNDESKKEKKK